MNGSKEFEELEESEESEESAELEGSGAFDEPEELVDSNKLQK